jgi:hypothetical protein
MPTNSFEPAIVAGFAFGAAGYAALRRFCSRGAKKAETAARRVA